MRPKKIILCVDDNEQVLSVRTFLLETRGYRVVQSPSAEHALEYMQQALPGTIDLLLCDLLMPQMDGNELVRQAQATAPGPSSDDCLRYGERSGSCGMRRRVSTQRSLFPG